MALRGAFSIIAFAAMLAPTAAQVDGPQAYAPDALARLHTDALQGAPTAMLAYGKALEGTALSANLMAAQANADHAEARIWFQKAADRGNAEAWYWLGMTKPGGAPQDFVLAAERGYQPAFAKGLDGVLFRAGPMADIDVAEHIADLARKAKTDLGYDTAGELATIDACYAAGTPALVVQRRRTSIPTYPDDNVGLAERYANGEGVTRDPQMAIALVCHGSDVPAELIDMVAAIRATASQPTLQKPFRFCDHVTSGENAALCAEWESEKGDRLRAVTFTQLTRGWTRGQKSAYAVFRRAAEAYFSEHAGQEQDMSGTLRGVFYIEEMDAKHDALLKDLRAFESGHLPSHDDFTAADTTLNTAYRAIMVRDDWSDMGTVNATGIRATQRLWLTYRDAWAQFAALRYPKMSADQWKAWATRQRIAELRSI